MRARDGAPSEAQRDACEGLADGTSCRVEGALGACRDQACEVFECGNGVREGTERCDGADLGDSTCATLGYDEETTGLACTDACQFDVEGCVRSCGDGEPWVCRATETNCTDAIDDDCDGAIDRLDSDCP